jgi:hypothetical protein
VASGTRPTVFPTTRKQPQSQAAPHSLSVQDASPEIVLNGAPATPRPGRIRGAHQAINYPSQMTRDLANFAALIVVMFLAAAFLVAMW